MRSEIIVISLLLRSVIACADVMFSVDPDAITVLPYDVVDKSLLLWSDKTRVPTIFMFDPAEMMLLLDDDMDT